MARGVMPATDVPATTGTTFQPWSCCAQRPGAIDHPEQLEATNPTCLSAAVPGTVAAALRAAGQWDWDRPRDLDAEDWWYHTTFRSLAIPVNHPCYLCLDGLATLAEVWLNGRRLLTTDNMFRGYRIDVRSHLQPHNELVIGFRSLTDDLKRK